MLSRSPHSTYLPALDGLRAIAILLVLFSHAGFEHLVPGGLGVTLFFVISGFLITGQMIAEIEQTQTFNIQKFYLRRLLRLMPALLLYLVTIGGALLWMGSSITPLHFLSGIFYFANYYHAFIGYTAHNPMPILWSLSVEEHFYLLFPLFILLFRRNLRLALPWLVGATVVALIWRIVLYTTCADSPWVLCGLPNHDRLFGTDALFDCILFGCVAIFSWHYWRDVVQRYVINSTAFIQAAAVLVVSLLYRDELFRQSLRLTLQSFSIAVLLLNILYGSWKLPENILSHPALRFIGRLSYSLYLFHYGALALINKVVDHEGAGLTGPIPMMAYFVLTALFALISYYAVEKPMLTLRHRFGGHQVA